MLHTHNFDEFSDILQEKTLVNVDPMDVERDVSVCLTVIVYSTTIGDRISSAVVSVVPWLRLSVWVHVYGMGGAHGMRYGSVCFRVFSIGVIFAILLEYKVICVCH